MTYTGYQLRRALVRAARALWEMNIHDPRDADLINMLFEANGWGAWLENETDGEGYANQPGIEYCGHTVGFAGRNVGDHLEPSQCVDVTIDPDLAHIVFPSTYRLSARDKWKEAGHDMPPHVQPENVKQGDIITVGSGKPYGTHIALVEYTPNSHRVRTIEGNAYGRRADGSEGKGVVKRHRELREIQRVYRLQREHFDQ